MTTPVRSPFFLPHASPHRSRHRNPSTPLYCSQYISLSSFCHKNFRCCASAPCFQRHRSILVIVRLPVSCLTFALGFVQHSYLSLLFSPLLNTARIDKIPPSPLFLPRPTRNRLCMLVWTPFVKICPGASSYPISFLPKKGASTAPRLALRAPLLFYTNFFLSPRFLRPYGTPMIHGELHRILRVSRDQFLTSNLLARR